MKLRFHAGSMRLRLSQREVALLAEAGRVEEAIVFAPGRELRYSIESTEAAPCIDAKLDGSNIRVIVPEIIAKQWAESEETGIQGSVGNLGVLIEKDFQCLHRAPEVGEDSFPNPLATKQLSGESL